MKKLALILALMIIPCSAFGLEMLNDNAMDQVTGQSGVSIALDDVQMFINIEKMAWIDCDGFGSVLGGYGTCEGRAGAVALNNFQIDVLNINAIVSSTVTDGGIQTSTNDGSMPLYSTACGQIPLFYNYGTAASATCYLGSSSSNANNSGLNNYISVAPMGSDGPNGPFWARAITIDATDNLPALSAGWASNNLLGAGSLSVGGVLIGIPTVEIYINSLTLRPVYDGDVSGNSSRALNDDTSAIATGLVGHTADFGVIALEGITFTTLSGWIEIAPH